MAILRTGLGLLLSALFLFAGSQKVYNFGMHQELVSKFESYVKVWHFDEHGVSAQLFRHVVGVAEMLLSVALWTPALRSLAALGLLSIMLGAAFTHHQLQEPFVVPLVLAGLALVFLVLSLTSKRSSRGALSTPALLLGLLLSAFFLLAGAQMVFPFGMHAYMVGNFEKFAALFQLGKSGYTGEHARHVVGVVEMTLAVALWAPALRVLAVLVLLSIMGAAAYTHFTLQEPFALPVVAAVLLLAFLLLSATSKAGKASDAPSKGKAPATTPGKKSKTS